MVFSTSAGQVVFNSYKDRTPLPEDVARANGHEELAQYLQDVHTRYCVKRNVGIQEVTGICWSHPHARVLRRSSRKRKIELFFLHLVISKRKNLIVAMFFFFF